MGQVCDHRDTGETAGPARVTTPAERRRAFRILFLSLTCLGMGQTVIFSILPPISRDLGISEFQVGAIFMVSAVFWLVMSPYWGHQSDKWGRKPVILVGLGGFAVSTLLFAGLIEWGLSGAMAMGLIYPLMIAARTIYGTLGPGAMSGGQAYVADRTDLTERTSKLAAMGAAFVLGTTIGPGLVAIFSGFGLLAPLYVAAGLGGFGFLAVWLYLPERSEPMDRPRASLSPGFFFDPRIRAAVLISVALAAAHAIPVQTIVFFMLDVLAKDAKLAAQLGGVVLMVSSVAVLVVQLVILPRLPLSGTGLMTLGAGLASAGFVIFLLGAWNIGFPAILVAVVILNAGHGLARAGAVGSASLAVTPDEQGAVAGVMGATGGAGFIVAPLLGMPLYTVSPFAPYALSLVFCAGVVIWLWLNPARAGD